MSRTLKVMQEGSMMKKTNAARLLDRLGIAYELLAYQVTEDDLSAEHVAAELGLPLNQVFKTMVLRSDKQEVFVCCLPGNGELNLKAVAHLIGSKKVDLVPSRELPALTGYLRGGCSPLGMKKSYPTWVDRSALEREFIVVSAGVRGLQLKLAPGELVRALEAKVAELTTSGSSDG